MNRSAVIPELKNGTGKAMNKNKLKTIEGLIIQEIDKELVLYDPSSNKTHSLNSVAAANFRLCDGSLTGSEIANKISEQFDLEEGVASEATQRALDLFSDEGLLEAHSMDFSRRSFLSSGLKAALLPLMMTLTVKTPASAGSQGCACDATGGMGTLCSTVGGVCEATAAGMSAGTNCVACFAPSVVPSNKCRCVPLPFCTNNISGIACENC